MSGLRKSVQAIYLSVSDGKLVRKFTEPGNGRFEVKNKEGKVHWEERYDELTATPTGCFLRENNFDGKKWKSYAFRFTDQSGTVYQIDLGEDSQNLRDMAGKLIGIDLNQEITVKPYAMKTTTNGKTFTNAGLTISIDGAKIQSTFYHSEQQPDGSFRKVYHNGYPPYPKDASDEDREIYKVQVRKYVKAAIEKSLMPKFKATELPEGPASVEPLSDDDLPF